MDPKQTVQIDYTKRFWSKVDKSGGPEACWPWNAGKGWFGHGQFWLNGKTRSAHVVAYEMEHGPVPEGKVVRHSCDFAPCCNQLHLRLGTQADNVADRVARGRSAVGEGNGNAKLTVEAVQSIRARHTRHNKLNGTTALAKEFGVTRKVIVDIVHNRIWMEAACAA
jgi:HNH endonuclease